MRCCLPTAEGTSTASSLKLYLPCSDQRRQAEAARVTLQQAAACAATTGTLCGSRLFVLVLHPVACQERLLHCLCLLEMSSQSSITVKHRHAVHSLWPGPCSQPVPEPAGPQPTCRCRPGTQMGGPTWRPLWLKPPVPGGTSFPAARQCPT